MMKNWLIVDKQLPEIPIDNKPGHEKTWGRDGVGGKPIPFQILRGKIELGSSLSQLRVSIGERFGEVFYDEEWSFEDGDVMPGDTIAFEPSFFPVMIKKELVLSVWVNGCTEDGRFGPSTTVRVMLDREMMPPE